MAGSHFDIKRAEVVELLDFFRFGKEMSPLSSELLGYDTNCIVVSQSYTCMHNYI